ncbi:MAG: glycogen/starch/alpha-glucan phosphorylase [Gammaproteobacteria bacterium]|nr:glycogen/starch/alpha-glucan phosphorylase [Gammaproteobacteria bacterium]
MSQALTVDALSEQIHHHLIYRIGKDIRRATHHDWRMALSYAVRDKIVEPWFEATRKTYEDRRKRVYYLSMEFLIGRILEDAMVNLGLRDIAAQALARFDIDLAKLIEDEPDPALGNGGLGRLAACFLESMATVECPAFGYGIRYEHGLFKQHFDQGRQVEAPETWLRQRHPWEFERTEVRYPIGFGGEVIERDGKFLWQPAQQVAATCYDTPVIGWEGKFATTLRLWSAKSVELFDLEKFNRGDHAAAAMPETFASTLSRVLYPDDTTEQGKELRLKQEYFLTSASIQDILRRFLSEYKDLRLLPEKAAIQLNDTHPAIAGPELVRLLVDVHGFALIDAIEMAQKTLNYTNHTLLPEALETWSTWLMGRVLPRHMQIIQAIDQWHHDQSQRPTHLGIVRHHNVHMGDLAFIMASKVNGVSALHSELVKSTVFADLSSLHPERVINQTNGITPRRWLRTANPRLSALITEAIGDVWTRDLGELRALEGFADDRNFLEQLAKVKQANKTDLAQYLSATCGVSVDPQAMFDVQVKRMHEYKRQLLNIFETIALWHNIRQNPTANWTPRVKIFGGKAAPGYAVAKEIIHLINNVADVINNDASINGLLKVVYPANYNVSMAQRLIPAAELSEQISTAGTEASGTGNMKFTLNGALTVGTLDGANVEIREHVGAENFFLFGMTAEQVVERRRNVQHAKIAIDASQNLRDLLQMVAEGRFSADNPARYHGIVDRAWHHDHYLVTSDFDDYYATQRQIDSVYQDSLQWQKMSLLNIARSGYFSSDRTIRGYMSDIWGIH